MTPGRLARQMLGNHFRPVGEAWRALFVDMHKVVEFMSPHIPDGSHVLDIGGGDGFVVNLLLHKRPDLSVTMTDLAAEIGTFIDKENLDRVRLLPETEFTQVQADFDVVTMSDVLHHVPVEHRPKFFHDLAAVASGKILIIKDIEPGHVRSVLSLLADRFITGDKGVSLVSAATATKFVRDALGVPLQIQTGMPSLANYCLVVKPS